MHPEAFVSCGLYCRWFCIVELFLLKPMIPTAPWNAEDESNEKNTSESFWLWKVKSKVLRYERHICSFVTWLYIWSCTRFSNTVNFVNIVSVFCTQGDRECCFSTAQYLLWKETLKGKSIDLPTWTILVILLLESAPFVSWPAAHGSLVYAHNSYEPIIAIHCNTSIHCVFVSL